MPAGVQFVGLPWSEETLLELAVRFEQARGAFPSPPLGTPISRSAPFAA
jgi:Asp-tRNA(Asn)/Glu-tRNA(Gln) amidotransferase A subunit family amidase